MFEARLRVIYGDTDQMGVVYYANYLRYFEFARCELLLARGASYSDLERQGGKLPVVEAQCIYKSPAKYEDLITVRISLSEIRRVSLTFEYEIFRERDRVTLCTGKTVHACVGQDGKPMRIPEAFARRLMEEQR